MKNFRVWLLLFVVAMCVVPTAVIVVRKHGENKGYVSDK